jgi:outer membrane lipase/esterase
MKKNLRSLAMCVLAAATLAACGGGGDGDQTPKIKYSNLVSFGDSLSDAGSYAVSTIAAPTVGGGKYTVNGANGKIWTELLATQLGLSAPCAAQTGLNSVIPGIPAVPVVNKAGCFSYGQGGSRVTNAVGVANLNTYPADPNGALGQLTVPVLSQINRHLLAVGGSFKGDELVSVLAGANDVFVNLGVVSAKVAAASAAPGATPASVGAAAQAASTEAVTAMGVTGAELAVYVKNLIVAKGAKYVVVVNLPNVSKTPLAYSLDAPTQGLVQLMTTTFNAQLAEGLKGSETEVVVVDAFTQSNDQATNPAQYSLTNTTTPACDFTKTIFASSLVCSASTLVAGDVSKYLFADAVHPTPYGYQLLAQFVFKNLAAKGWL